MPHSRLQHIEKGKTDAQAMCTPPYPTHIDAPRSSVPSTLNSSIPFKLKMECADDWEGPTNMEEAYRLTNALNCSLRSFGFGAHSLFDEADDGGEAPWAPKERHHSPTGVGGTKPYPVPSSSTPTTPSLPSPPLTLPKPSIPFRNTTKGGRKQASSHVEHRQRLKILDALATLLDTDDSRVAVTAFGPCLKEEVLQDERVVDRLAVDVVVCGPANCVADLEEGSVEDTTTTNPLQLILERRARVPLVDHAQAFNHFFSTLSSCSYPSKEFRITLSQLVKYIAASHAEKVVRRIKDNSLSGVLHRTFCTLVVQDPIVRTDSPRQPKGSSPSPTNPVSSGAPSPPMTRTCRAQMDRDHLFLGRLVHRSGDVQRILQGKVPLPNLTLLAITVLRGREGVAVVEPVNMYTDKTKAEFHRLLAWLLGSTEDGYLGALSAFVHLVREGCKGCDERAPNSVDGGKARRKWEKKVLKALNKLTLLGVLLRDALATSAFEAHLQAIAPLLLQVHRKCNQEKSRSPDSDRSPRGSPWSIDGMLGSAVPQFSLEDLGKNQENMDFNHATRLAHLKPWEEEEAVAEVYGQWTKGLVEHLEAVVVVQKWAMNGGRGCRVTVGTVIGLPRRKDSSGSLGKDQPGSVPTRMGDGEESTSSESDGGKAGGQLRKRQKLSHIEDSDANVTLGSSNIVLGLVPSWRDVLRDAYTDVPEYSDVAPGFDKVVELMEELIHRDTLPAGLQVPESWSAHRSTRWCPETCLATLLAGSCSRDAASTASVSTKRKSRKSDGRTTEHRRSGQVSAASEVNQESGVFGRTKPCLIGMSRGCCPSCSAVFTALASEPSSSEDCHSGAVPQHFLTTSSVNSTRAMGAMPEETTSESLWAGSHCCLPQWLPEDMAKRAVLEARRSLVRLVNGELEEQFDYLDSSEDEEYEEGKLGA